MARKRKFEEDRMRDAALRGGAPKNAELETPPEPEVNGPWLGRHRVILDGAARLHKLNDQFFWILDRRNARIEFRTSEETAVARARELVDLGKLK